MEQTASGQRKRFAAGGWFWLRYSALILPAVVFFAAPVPRQSALEILNAGGITGGLIVHLGCGDGRLTAALCANDQYVVHGLDADAENVAAARKYIQSQGLYGRVSVELWSGHRLPYADNMVNLLVAENLGSVPMDEVLRVLAPLGVVCIRGSDGAWTKRVKPWPKDIDEWTHNLHDAGGNPVAADKVVGPPRHLQWTAGPVWARSHGWTPSVSAMVSARGRLFYICDETLTGVDGTVPDKWMLVARDAFNGVLLWKRPIPNWGSDFFSGTAGNQGVGRFTMPPHLAKRFVAVGDTVYVTLGAYAPVTALDARTGAERRTYFETVNADEILYTEGKLVVALNEPREGKEYTTAKHVCALDPETGRILWKKSGFTGFSSTQGKDPYGRLELAAGDGQVFLLTEDTIESLSLDSGDRLWRIERPSLPEHAVRKLGFGAVYEYRLAVMVYHGGVVLVAQPEPNAPHTYHTMPGTLYAFDAKTGRAMWKRHYGGWGHCTPPDVFVANGLVWTHEDAPAEFASAPAGGVRAGNTSVVDYAIQGIDLKTGQVRQRFSTREIFDVEHHHRCYRNRSTVQFLMSSRRGVEFVDLASGENSLNHWVRSGCLLGNLPCNGLLYVAPHPCWCYIEAKLSGFFALAPETGDKSTDLAAPGKQADERLQIGPAYDSIHNFQSAIRNGSEWPTYRGDSRRSGATAASVAAEPKPIWQSQVGARLSGVVVADGKVLVADVDRHTVHALDAQSGKRLWQYTAGGRVDSPPTIDKGRVLFGSADGRVYCLRASDGALAWRFDAAPQERRVIAHNQIESPWPVPGSVLVHDDKVWFAAGRSTYLDGGIRVYALDPETGRAAREEIHYSPDPDTGKMIKQAPNKIPGFLNDIPGTDGANVFIRQMNISAPGAAEGRHLYTTAGFLDSSWFNRTFYKVGSAETTGLMVMSEDAAYGVEIYPSRSRETVFKPGVGGYRLMAFSPEKPAGRPKEKKAGRPGKSAPDSNVIWERQVPIRITAMVLAGERLFVAGSPDIVDPTDPHGAWEGRKGGVLAVFSAAEGKLLSESKLSAPPVWDGMAAGYGRLFIACLDGRLACLGN